MKENYNNKMKEIISGLETKKRLLLHACCAPCSSEVLRILTPHFSVEVFFFNPNIDDESEYNLRAGELVKFCKAHYPDVKVIVAPFNKEEFYKTVRGLEQEKEGGARCEKCIFLRLKETYIKAKSENFDFFTTTLSISPMKNAEAINSFGERLSLDGAVKYLYADFKKENGYYNSIQISKENGLYRQYYCGCSFSRSEKNNKN